MTPRRGGSSFSVRVDEWEVWHNYGQQAEGAPPLATVAERWVASGLAAVAYLSDGTSWAWDGRQARRDPAFAAEFALREALDRGAAGPAQCRPRDVLPVLDVEPDAWLSAARRGDEETDGLRALAGGLAAAERAAFSRVAGLPRPYVRALLPPLRFALAAPGSLGRGSAAARRLVCRPLLRLSDDGVLLLSLVARSGDRHLLAGALAGAGPEGDDGGAHLAMDLPTLLADVVRIDDRRVIAAETAAPAARALAAVARADRAVDRGRPIPARMPDPADESADWTALPRWPGGVPAVSDLAFLLARAATVAWRPPARSWRIGGRRARPAEGRGLIIARPHVHLLRFEAQGETADDNEAAHAAALATLVLQTERWAAPAFAARALPRNALAQGYAGAYLARGATLWAWARAGVREEAGGGPAARAAGAGSRLGQRCATVLRYQVVADLLDETHLRFRHALEWAPPAAAGPAALHPVRQAHAALAFAVDAAGASAEVRDVLRAGLEAMEVPRIRAWAAEELALRTAAATAEETARLARWGARLTLIAGMAGVPALAAALLTAGLAIGGTATGRWLLARVPGGTTFLTPTAAAPVGPTAAAVPARDLALLAVAALLVGILLAVARPGRRTRRHPDRP